MATVKGDVHDIGKNIVGVVLACNNYEIIDLGVMVPATKILQVAKDEKVDIIGLSGLITPSLDEMAHVAVGDGARRLRHSAADRRRHHQPRPYGGQNPSALRQGPGRLCQRRQPCGRRGVGLAVEGSQRPAMSRRVRAEYQKVTEAHHRSEADKLRLPLAKARANAHRIDWANYEPPSAVLPRHKGVRDLGSGRACALHRLDAVLPDLGTEGPLSEDPGGREAGPGRAPAFRRCAGDAARRSSTRNGSRRRRVIGFWPANAVGDDIRLFADETRTQELATFFTLRQQLTKRDGKPNVALADFVAPVDSGKPDYVGGFVVTAGIEEVAIAERFERANDDYNSILVKALGRPFRGSLRRAAARSGAQGILGLCARREPGAGRADRRALPGHPPGARLSRATRPYREGDPVQAARCARAMPASA